jgi:hypothetical protein
VKQVLPRVGERKTVTSGRGGDDEERGIRMNMVQTMYTHVHVESVSGILRGRMRAVEEGNSSLMYLIHRKNLCKCCSVLRPRTTIKKKIACQ